MPSKTNNPKLVVISGTPGTGKSTLALLLVKKLKWKRIDLSKHYDEVSTKYNKKKECYDINVKKLSSFIEDKIQILGGNVIVFDSHIAHLLPANMIDLCIVLTCSDITKLEDRLIDRGYSARKVKENVEAEIFQTCWLEAQANSVITFDTSKKVSQKQFLDKIKQSL